MTDWANVEWPIDHREPGYGIHQIDILDMENDNPLFNRMATTTRYMNVETGEWVVKVNFGGMAMTIEQAEKQVSAYLTAIKEAKRLADLPD